MSLQKIKKKISKLSKYSNSKNFVFKINPKLTNRIIHTFNIKYLNLLFYNKIPIIDLDSLLNKFITTSKF